MSLWFTLFKKEWLEMVRNFKIIWVPLTFLLLGSMDPLTSYYMPKMIDALGGLPEGTVIEIPYPAPPDSLMMSVAQFDTIGVLIIVLITMGLIAGERKSGVAAMILVKPVPFGFYITAKWAASLLLMWLSYITGMLASWYYTGVLFGWIPFGEFLTALILYGVWLTLIMTLTLFFSAVFKVPGLAGFCSIALAIVINLVSGVLSHRLKWSPALLQTYAGEYLHSGEFSAGTFPSILLATAAIILLIVFAIIIFRNKELSG